MEGSDVKDILDEIRRTLLELQDQKVLHPTVIERLSRAVDRLDQKTERLEGIQSQIDAIQAEILAPVTQSLEEGKRYSRLGYIVGLAGIIVSVAVASMSVLLFRETGADLRAISGMALYDVPTATEGAEIFMRSSARARVIDALECGTAAEALEAARELYTEFPHETASLLLKAKALMEVAVTHEPQAVGLHAQWLN